MDKWQMPTTIYIGENCINNVDYLKTYGDKFLLVTGRHSAKKSGALTAFQNKLISENIEYVIFDQIENNPTVETVCLAAEIAKKDKVTAIVGIGGGSPIDAAKAIAVLAKGTSINDMFQNKFTTCLPILAIPTTAGTGSEVTCYSVLIRSDLHTKVSFGNELTYPKIAFLDATFTQSLPHDITLHTAIDAFTHAFEGYFANRSTRSSKLLSRLALEKFGKVIPNLSNSKLTREQRRELLEISLLGGLVISQAGVTYMHGLGYCFTYYKNIPHGVANIYLLRSYLKYLEAIQPVELNEALAFMGIDTKKQLLTIFENLVGFPPKLTIEEARLYTKQSLLQKGSLSNTPGSFNETTIYEIWNSLTANELGVI